MLASVGLITLLPEHVQVLTSKEQSEDDGELVDPMTQYVLHHCPGDEGFITAVRLPQQKRFGGGFSGQGQRGKCVHNKINP